MTLVGVLTSSQDGASAGSSSVTFGLPAGSAVDQDCFFIVTSNLSSSSPPTTPAGFTSLAPFSVSNNNTGYAAYRRITSADISAGGFTIAVGGNRAQGIGAVLKDLDPITPYEVVPSANTWVTSPNPAPASATTVDGSDALELATSRSSAPAISDIGFSAGWSELAQYSTAAGGGANETASIAHKVLAAAGSVGGDDVSFTQSNLAVVTIATRKFVVPGLAVRRKGGALVSVRKKGGATALVRPQ